MARPLHAGCRPHTNDRSAANYATDVRESCRRGCAEKPASCRAPAVARPCSETGPARAGRERPSRGGGACRGRGHDTSARVPCARCSDSTRAAPRSARASSPGPGAPDPATGIPPRAGGISSFIADRDRGAGVSPTAGMDQRARRARDRMVRQPSAERLERAGAGSARDRRRLAVEHTDHARQLASPARGPGRRRSCALIRPRADDAVRESLADAHRAKTAASPLHRPTRCGLRRRPRGGFPGHALRAGALSPGRCCMRRRAACKTCGPGAGCTRSR
jgi:hypothetical protein